MHIAQITGTGAYVPGPPIDNKTLSKHFGRRLIWLCKTLGSKYRHSAIDPESGELRDGLSNSEMAHRAATAALENAGRDAREIDLIVAASATPDFVFPAGALFVQERLGLQGIKVIELRAGCGGMVQAFAIAKGFLESGVSRRALLIGTEFASPYSVALRSSESQRRVTNDDLATLAMMGDGAGAVVLEVGDRREGGVRNLDFASVGVGRSPGLTLRQGGALEACGGTGEDLGFTHDFRLILKYSGDIIGYWLEWAKRNEVDVEKVQYVIPPQATSFAVNNALKEFDVSGERFFNLFPEYGNTASAGLYIALDRLNRTGRLKKGDRVQMLPTEATKWLYGVIDVEWSLGA